MARQACIDCEYSEVTEASSEFYVCRRHAARPFPASSDSVGERLAWPMVHPEDRCGEFLERDPAGEDQDPLASPARPAAKILSESHVSE